MKNIKIGSILNLLFLFNAFAEVSLKISSVSNFNIKSATVGVPFNIVVNVKDEDFVSSDPEINGLNSLNVLNVQRSSNTTIINGNKQSEQNFLYQVRVDKPGKIFLGPAKVKTNKGEVVSQVLEFEVTKIPENIDDKISEPIFYKLKINKKNIYVGETFSYQVIFGTTDENIQLNSLQTPDMLLKDLKFSSTEGPYGKIENINGKKYHISELTGAAYSTVSGEIVIPVLKAIYRRGFFQNVVYSQPVAINIKKLPDGPDVDAVGKFSNIAATLNKTKINQNEACTLELKIEGSGNLEGIKFPKLILPKSLQSFESTENIEKKIKKFEYVIQPLQAGSIEIAPQKFTFFDPSDRKYKTLTTKKLKLEVTPAKTTELKEEKEIVQEKEEIERESSNEIDKIIEKYKQEKSVMIPWNIFFLLFMLPLLFLLLGYKNIIYKKFIIFKNLYKRKYAFYFAKRELKKAEKKNQTEKIYGIFIDFFYRKFFEELNIEKNYLTEDLIEKELKQHGLHDAIIAQWREFNKQLLLYSYYLDRPTVDLFVESYKWIKKFSEILK